MSANPPFRMAADEAQWLDHWLGAEEQGSRWRAPLLAVTVILVLTAAATLFMQVVASWGASRREMLWALAAGWSAVGIVLLIAWRGRGSKARETAKRLDDQLHTGNRLEALVEMSKVAHPLAEAQRSEVAQSFANRVPQSNWPGQRNAMVLTCAAAAIVQIVLMLSVLGMFSPKAEIAPEPAAKEQAEEPAEPDTASTSAESPTNALEIADLRLIDPDPYVSAEAFDEVPLKAEGQSPHGFDSFELETTVNDGEPQRTTITGPTGQPQSVQIEQALELAAMKLEPFDLVSYTLVARSTLDGEKDVEVRSAPQFLLVKAMEEDALILKSPSSGGEKQPSEAETGAVTKLAEALNRQLDLIGETSRLAEGLKKMDEKRVDQFQKELAKKQSDIANDLVEVAETTPAADVPAGLVAQVRGAAEAAKTAGGQMHDPARPAQPAAERVESLRAATTLQRKAAALLVDAIEMVDQGEMFSPDAAADTESSQPPQLPVDKEQNYAGPAVAAESTPEAELERLVEKQAKVNDALMENYQAAARGASEPVHKDVAAKEAEVAERLQKLAAKPAIDTVSRKEIAEAARAAQQLTQTASAGSPEAALADGQRAQAQVQRSLDTLRDQADRRAEQAMRQAQTAVHEATRELIAKDRPGADQMMREAAAHLHHEAVRQNEGGRARHAEKLSQLAGEVAKDVVKPASGNAKGATKENTEKAIKDITTARDQGWTPQQRLADAASRLNAIASRLKQAQSGAAPIRGPELKPLGQALELALGDLARATSEFSKEQAKAGAGEGAQETPAAEQAKTEDAAARLASAARAFGLGQGESSDEALSKSVIAEWLPILHDLSVEGRRRLHQVQKRTLVQDSDPEDAPQIYRDDVAVYFQNLSGLAKPGK